MSEQEQVHALRRWAWPLLIGCLAVTGLLLALADVAIGTSWPSPLASGEIVRPVIATPGGGSETFRFDRNRFGQKFVIEGPIAGLGPLNPILALRSFLSNGAGLVLLALAALVIFPTRARNAVERLEGRYGAPIALAAGVAMFLLLVAALTLLRFTLVFLAVIPVVLLFVLLAALFGIACISLAIGRLLNSRLRLNRVHPLVPALAGALVVFDLAVIPFAGVFALGVVAIAGLGLAVVTRFGSSGGWTFGDLNW